jgi:hypothetical protein
LLDGHRGDSREHLTLRVAQRGQVANDEDLRVLGNTQVGLDGHAPAAVHRQPKLAAERRRLHAGGPQRRVGRDDVVAAAHVVGGDVGGAFAQPDLDAEPLERALGARRQIGRVLLEHSVAAFQQDHPRLARIERPEVVPHGVASDLGDGARQLHAGRPAAHDDKRQQRLTRGGIGCSFGAFERQQDAPTDVERVFQRLQPRRGRFPFGMTEVRVAGTGRQHQVVVAKLGAVGEFDAAGLRVDGGDLAEQHLDVAVLAEDRAQRLGDLARRQGGGGDLVQQRLEQVVVHAVDEHDPQGVARERARGIQPAEAAADDQDSGTGHAWSIPRWSARGGLARGTTAGTAGQR